jgi:hypothetical protein
MPELADIPVLGRIAVLLSGTNQLNDTHALEEFQRAKDRQKAQREKERDDNSRYVIKVSEALKCVDDSLFNTGVLMAFLKGLVNVILGKTQTMDDLMYDKIKTCILENRLRQDTPRVFSTTGRYHRPSRGHGKGRSSFG